MANANGVEITVIGYTMNGRKTIDDLSMSMVVVRGVLYKSFHSIDLPLYSWVSKSEKYGRLSVGLRMCNKFCTKCIIWIHLSSRNGKQSVIAIVVFLRVYRPWLWPTYTAVENPQDTNTLLIVRQADIRWHQQLTTSGIFTWHTRYGFTYCGPVIMCQCAKLNLWFKIGWF